MLRSLGRKAASVLVVLSSVTLLASSTAASESSMSPQDPKATAAPKAKAKLPAPKLMRAESEWVVGMEKPTARIIKDQFDSKAAFEMLKQLEGKWGADWDGRTIGPKDGPVPVTYEVTSDGSVVTEVTAPGTPEEMTSQFFLVNDELVVSHFCALGNQPQMSLRTGGGSKGRDLSFTLTGGTNLKASTTTGFMVLVALKKVTDDHLETVWQTRMPDGQMGGTYIVTLKRMGKGDTSRTGK